MSDDSISEAEYEFYYSLENDGEMTTTIDKDILKDILRDIINMVSTTTITPECETETMRILQKITRL